MYPHRICLLLAISLAQACIFSRSNVEPTVDQDMPLDMRAMDMAQDLATPDSSPDQDVPDQDVPDQYTCPEANCVATCEGNTLTNCQLDANDCLVPAQTTCPSDTRCDANIGDCLPDPCNGEVKILCDPNQPNKYISCEEQKGVIVPLEYLCMDNHVCQPPNDTTNPDATCIPFECMTVGERSCVNPKTEGVCEKDEDNNRLIITEQECGDNEICDGNQCRQHHCTEDQLDTTRCTDDPGGEETCMPNQSGRRVWIPKPCGIGQACSDDMQRCMTHQCTQNKLNTTYCEGTLGGRVVKCSLDGGVRVKTVIQECNLSSCRQRNDGPSCGL